MKRVIAMALLCALPLWGTAQAAVGSKSATAKAKISSGVAKDSRTSAGKPAVATQSSRVGKAVKVAALTGVGAGALGAAGMAVATARPAESQDTALQALAEQVHVGRMPCELGAHVTVTPDTHSPGHFHVEGKGFKYHMAPVATSTGTLRLEDAKAGAVWLQIANKSMLMNQKLGQRMADECMSPAQVQVAEAIKKNPPRSVLD